MTTNQERTLPYKLIIAYTNGAEREYPIDAVAHAVILKAFAAPEMPDFITIGSKESRLAICTRSIASIAIKKADA